jgi:hypothetical protein
LTELQHEHRRLSTVQQGSAAHLEARARVRCARKAARRIAQEWLEQQEFNDPAAFAKALNTSSGSHNVPQAAQERHVKKLPVPLPLLTVPCLAPMRSHQTARRQHPARRSRRW